MLLLEWDIGIEVLLWMEGLLDKFQILIDCNIGINHQVSPANSFVMYKRGVACN